MRITRRSGNRRGGSSRGVVLVPALFVAFLLAGLVASFLRVLLAHTSESLASTTGLQTFYVAEAGVSAAMAEIESGKDPGGDGLGTLSDSFAEGNYQVTTTVTQPNKEWSIVSVGNLRSSTRSVQAVLTAQSTSLFLKALFSGGSFDISRVAFTDSYDTRLGSYASQRVNVDPVTGVPYAHANGDIGANAGINASGAVTIIGDATPGPGYNVTKGKSVYISGSTAPAPQPTVLPPVTYAPTTPSLGAYSLGGTKTQTLTSGTYHYSTFRTSRFAVLTCTGNVTLYVDGNFEISGSSRLVVAAGAHVTINHGSGYWQVSGGGVANTGQNPKDFIVYSATTGHVENSGSSSFYGAIYAPASDLWLTGSSETYGSIVGGALHVTGTSNFHYDEALADLPGLAPPTYTIQSWREIASP